MRTIGTKTIDPAEIWKLAVHLQQEAAKRRPVLCHIQSTSILPADTPFDNVQIILEFPGLKDCKFKDGDGNFIRNLTEFVVVVHNYVFEENNSGWYAYAYWNGEIRKATGGTYSNTVPAYPNGITAPTIEPLFDFDKCFTLLDNLTKG